MIQIYGNGFPESDRKTYTPIIYSNIITSMKTLCIQSDVFSAVDPSIEASKQLVLKLKGNEVVDEELAKHITSLWKDSGIQQTYSMRAKYQLTDSAPYFFGKMDVIKQDDYIPTKDDVLRSRVRTTGIVENEFNIDGNQFKMFDVGGQRNERKKWIHCFEKVTAVLFVAAISEYDQVLYEDENTNRMVEALNLFEEICNSRWFRETAMILFLNKRDLFMEKIERVPLTVCFSDYEEDLNCSSYKSGCIHITMQFESLSRNDEKQIYPHITCATDTDNVKFVFNAVKDIIIRRSLNEAGLV
jgi:guanine nucleotide-binding protein G(i) subunit alpha